SPLLHSFPTRRSSDLSIHDPALAIAENARGCSIERDLVNFVGLRCGNVKPILLIEAQMPQALGGNGREESDRTLRIDLQHLVISVVHDIKISLAIECNSVWAVEKITLCERRNGPVLRNLCDRIAATIRDEDITRLLVDRDSDRAVQAAGS